MIIDKSGANTEIICEDVDIFNHKKYSITELEEIK